MNTVRTQEEWRRLADMSAEKNVPEGWVYVGYGMGDLGFGCSLMSRVQNELGWIGKTNWGAYKHSEYACPVKIWEKETGLKFKPEKTMEVTLTQIKKELEEAKKLIGKTIGVNIYFKVNKVELVLEEKDSISARNSVKTYGYAVVLYSEGNAYSLAFNDPHLKVREEVKINGYVGEDKGSHWEFGCAKIDTNILKAAHNLLQIKSTDLANRKADFVQIGAGQFTLETLNKMFPNG